MYDPNDDDHDDWSLTAEEFDAADWRNEDMCERSGLTHDEACEIDEANGVRRGR